LLHLNDMRCGYFFAHSAPPETKKPSGTNPEGHRGRESRFSPEDSPFGIRLSPDYLDPSGM
jgi:hypothetical protein